MSTTSGPLLAVMIAVMTSVASPADAAPDLAPQEIRVAELRVETYGPRNEEYRLFEDQDCLEGQSPYPGRSGRHIAFLRVDGTSGGEDLRGRLVRVRAEDPDRYIGPDAFGANQRRWKSVGFQMDTATCNGLNEGGFPNLTGWYALEVTDATCVPGVVYGELCVSTSATLQTDPDPKGSYPDYSMRCVGVPDCGLIWNGAEARIPATAEYISVAASTWGHTTSLTNVSGHNFAVFMVVEQEPN